MAPGLGVAREGLAVGQAEVMSGNVRRGGMVQSDSTEEGKA